MTEKKLLFAFDFQRFEKNARLQKVIDETHSRLQSRELNDDELDGVAAAGEQTPSKPNKPGDLPI